MKSGLIYFLLHATLPNGLKVVLHALIPYPMKSLIASCLQEE